MAKTTSCLHLFFLLSFLLLLSFTLAKIRFSEIRSDPRSVIAFNEFGFTHDGRLELNVSNIFLSDSNPDLDLSKIGFFLTTHDALLRVFQQLEDAEITCPLQSDLIRPVFTFNKLLKDQRVFSTLFAQNDADRFTLVFANCLTNLKVSMDVLSSMYNIEKSRSLESRVDSPPCGFCVNTPCCHR